MRPMCSNQECSPMRPFFGTQCVRVYYNEPRTGKCPQCKKVFDTDIGGDECPYCKVALKPKKMWQWECPKCGPRARRQR